MDTMADEVAPYANHWLNVEPSWDHPAKFNAKILEVITNVLDDIGFMGRILDPFAGVGGIHTLSAGMDSDTPETTRSTLAVELEPEWASASAEVGWTACADFLKADFINKGTSFHRRGEDANLTLFPGHIDAIVTSPTYGNRMADHHEARDGSKRLTYRHRLGRALSKGSSAAMQWGQDYQWFHLSAWAKSAEILRGMCQNENAWLLLNVKDHPRKGEIMHVTDWHCDALRMVGFRLVDRVRIPVNGMGFGANQSGGKSLKVSYEELLVARLDL